MPNPNGESCSDCLYFRDDECHRHPPNNGDLWPAVAPTDWCGEWAPIQEENPA